MSADNGHDYLSDGITENIISGLSRFRDLTVIASYSAFSYKGKALKIQDVGRELGVRFVLEGSVQKSSGRVRITAQLIDAITGAHLWAEQFDRGAEISSPFSTKSPGQTGEVARQLRDFSR